MEKIIPEKWVLVESVDGAHRVLCGWDSDQTWSMSNPIISTEDQDGVVVFKTKNEHYLCSNNKIGFTELSRIGFDKIKKTNPETKIIVFDDPT